MIFSMICLPEGRKEMTRMFFGRKKKPVKRQTFDPAVEKPILKKSICTGETTAGLKDLKTGKYTDLALIRNEEDLQADACPRRMG